MRRLSMWIACFAVVCVLSEGLMLAHAPKSEAPAADNAALRTVLAMAGQFRIVFANLLWIKVDKYHHEYIEHHGNWAENPDILPLLRMITWLDPHFIQAYQVAGFMLSGNLKRYDFARQLLAEEIQRAFPKLPPNFRNSANKKAGKSAGQGAAEHHDKDNQVHIYHVSEGNGGRGAMGRPAL